MILDREGGLVPKGPKPASPVPPPVPLAVAAQRLQTIGNVRLAGQGTGGKGAPHPFSIRG